MTVSVQTLIDRSVRNMGAVHSHVKSCAVELIKRAYKEGIYVQISAGMRTNAQQNALYAQGRTKPGNIVTNAKAGQSIHNYGYAIDYFLVTPDGKNSIWTVNKDWKRVAAIGKSLGFTWGGDWKGFVDYPHLDFAGNHSWQEFANGWRPKLPSKVPGGTSNTNIKKLQKNLIKLGFKLPKFGADGYMGDETVQAIKKLQKEAEIKVDGLAGKATEKAITRLLKGGLTMSQYSELKKMIQNVNDKVQNVNKKVLKKADVAATDNTPDPAHDKNWAWLKKEGITNGVHPHLPLSREQFATMLHNYDIRRFATGVVAGESHAETWKWLVDEGLSNGDNPHGYLTREQFATLLKRYDDMNTEDKPE